MGVAPFLTEPQQLLGPCSPYVARTGQPSTRRLYDTGIHLCRHRRVQGPVGSGSEAVRHTPNRGLRCGRGSGTGVGVSVPGSIVNCLGIHWRPGTARGRCPGRRVPASGASQSPPGAGLCRGHGEAGQDRCSGSLVLQRRVRAGRRRRRDRGRRGSVCIRWYGACGGVRKGACATRGLGYVQRGGRGVIKGWEPWCPRQARRRGRGCKGRCSPRSRR